MKKIITRLELFIPSVIFKEIRIQNLKENFKDFACTKFKSKQYTDTQVKISAEYVQELQKISWDNTHNAYFKVLSVLWDELDHINIRKLSEEWKVTYEILGHTHDITMYADELQIQMLEYLESEETDNQDITYSDNPDYNDILKAFGMSEL